MSTDTRAEPLPPTRAGLARLWLVLAAVAVSSSAACGTDAAEPDNTASSSPLPPTDVALIADELDPMLEPLGLQITRAVLVDRSNGGYEPSPDGTHLGLYAEPISDDYRGVDYIENLWPSTAILTPYVFERWSGLDSYDFCQEPLPADDPRPEPKALTQVEIFRVAAETIDWDNGDLSVLLDAAEAQDARVHVDGTLTSEPQYQAALATAATR